jgi:hemerythrin-like domain-containing protein
MLQGITSAPSATSSRNVVDLLIDCHQKIRHFAAVVQKLAHAEGASLSEISSAADSAYRYFTVSLPLHEADEEESLHPRLLSRGEQELAAALDSMCHQHQAIDDLIERLLPVLRLVASNPAALPQAHAELCTLSKALLEIFQGHLELEEKVIFPAVARTLSSTSQSEMLAEMQQRRKQG